MKKINNTDITSATETEKESLHDLEKNTQLDHITPHSLGLSLWQRLVLRINGCVFLRYEKHEGWRSFLPIYFIHCKEHGYFLDYPHGYSEYFSCPLCK